MIWILIYLLAINLVTFVFYGIDKYKAKKNKWRIQEKVLLGLAVAGGTVGAICGIYFFRHKTQHYKFKIGVPLILILQIAMAVYLVTR